MNLCSLSKITVFQQCLQIYSVDIKYKVLCIGIKESLSVQIEQIGYNYFFLNLPNVKMSISFFFYWIFSNSDVTNKGKLDWQCFEGL